MTLFDVVSGSETTSVGLVTQIGNVLSALLGWIPSVFETMVSSPIVLIFVLLAIIGAVIAFARKILM